MSSVIMDYSVLDDAQVAAAAEHASRVLQAFILKVLEYFLSTLNCKLTPRAHL
jgi:hypothetical protein